jgi:hypothetical protein
MAVCEKWCGFPVALAIFAVDRRCEKAPRRSIAASGTASASPSRGLTPASAKLQRVVMEKEHNPREVGGESEVVVEQLIALLYDFLPLRG